MENRYCYDEFREFINCEKTTSYKTVLSSFKESKEEYQKSYEILKDLADKGEANSQYYLGLMYLNHCLVLFLYYYLIYYFLYFL